MKVSCILVNWNGWQDTNECLRALKACAFHGMTVIVVDNGSTDGSVERIKAAHADTLVLQSGRNLGFAGGNNVGIRYAMEHGADFIWLLNSDTTPAPDALSMLVAKAMTDSRIGAVASVCYYASSPERVQVWGGTKVNLWIGYTNNSVEPRSDGWFDALYGASLLISCAALRDVGLLDEGFFFSWEETEFCLRLRKKGWLLAAAPESRVLHKVGTSTGGKSPMLDRYFTTSGLRILRLHSEMPSLAMFLFLAIRFGRRLAKLRFARCRSVWDGMRDYRATLPILQRIR